jgi:hypothetical protein
MHVPPSAPKLSHQLLVLTACSWTLRRIWFTFDWKYWTNQVQRNNPFVLIHLGDLNSRDRITKLALNLEFIATSRSRSVVLITILNMKALRLLVIVDETDTWAHQPAPTRKLLKPDIATFQPNLVHPSYRSMSNQSFLVCKFPFLNLYLQFFECVCVYLS